MSEVFSYNVEIDRYPIFEARRCRGCPQDGVSVNRAEMGYVHLCPVTLDFEVIRLADDAIEEAARDARLEVIYDYQDLADTV